ncbi:MAG: hypothetical protein V4721_01395 [Bacteroidota bacterium]
MTFLQKQYTLETLKSKEEILLEAQRKIEGQKVSNSFFGLDLVNYKNFRIQDDSIEIESWPIKRVNPYEGIGTIKFEFYSAEKTTRINCTLTPYNKYATLLSSCFFAFFLLLFAGFTLLMLYDRLIYALVIIGLASMFVIGTIFLTLLYYRNVLEIYSKTVLKDLGVKFRSS